MADENIFSGLKVVDLASFIAGPGAATILSDYGADVIKVEPPGSGDPHRHTFQLPPQPRSKDNYAWHLDNRNKRGMSLDLKSPHARPVLERLIKWADVLVVNFPHPARKRLKLTYEEFAAWNPRLIYTDITGYGDNGPDADLPGFDITAFWARTGLLSLTRDSGAPPTLPPSGSGDHATAVGLYGAIVTALYRRERTGKGGYVTTSLLAQGVWSGSMYVQAAYAGSMTEMLDKVLASQTLDRWRHAFDQAHFTYGVVRSPHEVTTDPQLLANDVIVPLEGAGEHLKLTVSSPLTVHGAEKVPARRAPELGEHNDEILKQLGFSGDEIDGLRANGAVPHAWHLESTAGGAG